MRRGPSSACSSTRSPSARPTARRCCAGSWHSSHSSPGAPREAIARPRAHCLAALCACRPAAAHRSAGALLSAARPLSAEATRPISAYFWSRDARYVIYAQDAAGGENYNVYAIDPTLPADPKTGVPPTRALTDLSGVLTEIYDVPRAKPDLLYIALNDRDAQWHDLYELRLSTGERKLLRKNTEKIAGWDFDHAGELRATERTNPAGDTEVLRVDADGMKVVHTCSVLEECHVVDFSPDNASLYLATNKSSLDLGELDVLDLRKAALTKLESDPLRRVDFDSALTSDIDHHFFFTQYEDDRDAESPLTKARSIVTPLMVVQGKNDPRVNIRESNQIVAAVRDNGRPVEYLVAPDEKHGFARPINNLAMWTAMEKFLTPFLGGRAQKDVPADVAERLKVLTVDPKTVDGTVQAKTATPMQSATPK